jgi:hypothetical protein
MKLLREEMQKELQDLVQVIQQGWPDKKNCPAAVQEYFNHRDELTIMDGIVFKGEKIVVPPSLRKEML